jgi:hypothetical protein
MLMEEKNFIVVKLSTCYELILILFCKVIFKLTFMTEVVENYPINTDNVYATISRLRLALVELFIF